MKIKATSINPETLFMSVFQESKKSSGSENHYMPGSCNIGPEEIHRRKKAAIFSFVLTFAVIVLLFILDTSKIWRLVLFLPATSFGVSFQQWYFKFCVAFGIKGVFNFGELGKTFSIDQKENYRKDRIKAWQMIIAGIVFGLIITLIFYFMA